MSPPDAAASTTWLLVKTVPSERSTTPEPSSVPLEPVTVIDTTLGWTAAATFASCSVGFALPDVTFTTGDDVTLLLEEPPSSACAMRPPITPASRRSAARPAPRRTLRRWSLRRGGSVVEVSPDRPPYAWGVGDGGGAGAP